MKRFFVLLFITLTVAFYCFCGQGLAGESVSLFPIEQNGKWGYIDNSGKVVVKPSFDQAGPFSENLGAVCSNGKCGFVNANGQLVIKPQFDEGGMDFGSFGFKTDYTFSEGLACVKVGDKWGYIDKTGRFVINPRFYYAENFHEGLALIVPDGEAGEFGFINKEGKIVIRPQYDWYPEETPSFSNGLAPVFVNTNKPGEKVANRKFGFIDKQGKMVIKPQFDRRWSFSEGLAAVEVNGKYGYINEKGEMVIKPQFDSGSPFKEGLAFVFINRKWGCIDKSGKVVIQPAFDSCNDFSEGFAAVQINDKYGYIDKSGKLVIEPQFYSADAFSNGLAQVTIGSKDARKLAYINKTGNIVWPPESANAQPAITVEINGEKQSFSPAPLMISGRVMVPLRGIFESLDAEVQWDDKTRTVSARKDDSEISLQIGADAATINGETVQVSPPAQIINGSTFVPLRFVSEALGADVGWDESTRTVSITTKS